METLLYLSSVSLLIIIGVYIIWSLRSQSEDMYHDLKVSKIQSEIKRLESEKEYIKEVIKAKESHSEEIRSCAKYTQELYGKIESLNSELLLCKHTAKEENLRHKREVQSLQGHIGKMTQTINSLKKRKHLKNHSY